MTSIKLGKTLEYLKIQESLRSENLIEYYLCERIFLCFSFQMHFNNCNRSMTFQEPYCTIFSDVILLILFMADICLKLLFHTFCLRINSVAFLNMHCTFILCAFMYLFIDLI